MRFLNTGLAGAFLIEVEPAVDERGLFARTVCEREFAGHGLNSRFVQCNTAWSRFKNTLRGMHYQAEPYAEDKLVRCTRGAIYDVIVDLRPGSVTRLQWWSAELTAENRRAIFVPQGVAHGFLTLADDSEVLYQMSAYYEPAAARGVRWNDPAFAIDWPGQVLILSERDRSYPDFPS